MRILKLGWLILFVLIFDPCLPVLLGSHSRKSRLSFTTDLPSSSEARSPMKRT